MSSLYLERDSTIRLALLISGGGSTMSAISRACRKDGPLYGKVMPVVVIADRDCPGVNAACNLELPAYIVRRKIFPPGNRGSEMHGRAVLAALSPHRPSLVTQNGWLSLTSRAVIEKFSGSIYNQHPAPLDPDNRNERGEPLHFGGTGIYGRAAHESVLVFQHLADRRFATEATIHRVVPEFDEGPVVFREPVAVLPEDSTKELAARVLPVEHTSHIKFLGQLYENRVTELSRSQPLIRPGEEHILYQAKAAARTAYPHG